MGQVLLFSRDVSNESNQLSELAGWAPKPFLEAQLLSLPVSKKLLRRLANALVEGGYCSYATKVTVEDLLDPSALRELERQLTPRDMAQLATTLQHMAKEWSAETCDLCAPHTAESLRAYADEHHIRDCLGLTLDVMRDPLGRPPVHLSSAAHVITLEELLTSTSWRDRYGTTFRNSEVEKLWKAAAELLNREASAACRALNAEVQWLERARTPTGHAVRDSVIARLLDVYDWYRSSVTPRLPAQPLGVSVSKSCVATITSSIGYSITIARIDLNDWQERELVVERDHHVLERVMHFYRGSGDALGAPTRTLHEEEDEFLDALERDLFGDDKDAPLHLALPAPEIPAAHPVLSRDDLRDARHAQQALGALIDWLHGLAGTSVHLQRLAVPSWQRTLDELDGLADAHDAAQRDTRIVWYLSNRHLQWRLMPLQEKLLKSGAWGRAKALKKRDLAAHPAKTDSDARVIDLLLLDRNSYDDTVGEAALIKALQVIDVDRLCTGKSREVAVRVVWNRPKLRARLVGDGVITLDVDVGGKHLPLAEAGRAFTGAAAHGGTLELDEMTGELSVVLVDDAAAKVVCSLADGPTRWPVSAYEGLVRLASRLDRTLPLELPAELRGSYVTVAPTLVVQIDPGSETLRLRIRARPLGDAALVPAEGPLEIVRSVDGARCWTKRDLERERADAQLLVASLALPETADHTWDLAYDDNVFHALETLQRTDALPSNLHVVIEWAKASLRQVGALQPSSLKIQVTRKRDWFNVQGAASIDDETVTLAMLIDAVRRGHRYVRLSSDKFAKLTEALADNVRALAASTAGLDTGLDGVRLGAAAPLLLTDTLRDLGAADLHDDFAAQLERARAAASYEPVIPEGFAAVLRPYQRDGVRWLLRLAACGTGAVLADDMGLGKTVQTLAVLQSRMHEGPALVIAPTSVCANWRDEAHRFVPELRARLMHDTSDAQARQALVDGLAAGDLLIASYGLLVANPELFTRRAYTTVVFDEAHGLKNATTQRAKAAANVRAEYRLGLTGTPLENRLDDIWSLFEIVCPGVLGTVDAFRKRFVTSIDGDHGSASTAELRTLLAPFILRRRKAEVAPELPAKTEVTRRLSLSAAEQAIYEQVRLAAVGALRKLDPTAETTRFAVFAQLTRLRLAACHPRLIEPDTTATSAKLEALVGLLSELRAEGHRALVFSQFTSFLDLAGEALVEADVSFLRLDGSTPASLRANRVTAFQRGEADVFLLSLKAGGTGLNLTAADYVVHLDPWWNPAAEDQASDRAHRLGQSRPVTVVRFAATGTVEEVILDMQADKRALADAVLAGGDVAGHLSTSELVALIGDAMAVRNGAACSH